MTFGHSSFDHWASEGVRTFRTAPAPPPPPKKDLCLDFFNEHKNKSLYPAMGSSGDSIPRLAGMENATGLGAATGVEECACVCYEDPDCVAFHIHTKNTNPNTPKRQKHCAFWRDPTSTTDGDKHNNRTSNYSQYMGPGDEGITDFDLVIDSYILRPIGDIDAILASREDTTGEDNGSNGNDDLSDCPDCPPNHMKAKSNGQCTCISSEAIGKGLSTVGKGLGMLALGGVAVTGIVVYGVYRLIRG